MAPAPSMTWWVHVQITLDQLIKLANKQGWLIHNMAQGVARTNHTAPWRASLYRPNRYSWKGIYHFGEGATLIQALYWAARSARLDFSQMRPDPPSSPQQQLDKDILAALWDVESDGLGQLLLTNLQKHLAAQGLHIARIQEKVEDDEGSEKASEA